MRGLTFDEMIDRSIYGNGKTLPEYKPENLNQFLMVEYAAFLQQARTFKHYYTLHSSHFYGKVNGRLGWLYHDLGKRENEDPSFFASRTVEQKKISLLKLREILEEFPCLMKMLRQVVDTSTGNSIASQHHYYNRFPEKFEEETTIFKLIGDFTF